MENGHKRRDVVPVIAEGMHRGNAGFEKSIATLVHSSVEKTFRVEFGSWAETT